MNRATKIINAWADGEDSLAGEVFTALETELKNIAQARLNRDNRQGDVVEPGDLISELFLKLDADFKRYDRSFEKTEKFLALASRVMRQLLLDMAKKGGAKAPKRNEFTSVIKVDDQKRIRRQLSTGDYYLALDRLKKHSPDLWLPIDLHFIHGYTLEECVAQIKELSERLDADDAALKKEGKEPISRATFVRRLKVARQYMGVQLGWQM